MSIDKVSSVVWPWRENAAAAGAPKKAGPKYTAVVIQAAVVAGIGWLVYAWLKHPVMAAIVWGMAGVILVSGLFVPPVFNAIERFGQWLGKWVGEIVTWLLLTPFFYLCFVPMRLVAKLRGKDPLRRRFDPAATTYWIPRKPTADAAQYRKQF